MILGRESMSKIDLNEESIANLVRLCARGFNRALQIRLAQHNIGFGQWVFLRILWRGDGLTQRELSELAALTEPTTHTALLRMEREKLVVRRNEAGNRRKQYVYLTPRGRELETTLSPLAAAVSDLSVSGVSRTDLRHLREMLVAIVENLNEDELREGRSGRRVPPTRADLA
jgi:DNA-binding MarR family transcriptional regulator